MPRLSRYRPAAHAHVTVSSGNVVVAIAATSFGSPYTAFGVSSSSDRLYAIPVR